MRVGAQRRDALRECHAREVDHRGAQVPDGDRQAEADDGARGRGQGRRRPTCARWRVRVELLHEVGADEKVSELRDGGLGQAGLGGDPRSGDGSAAHVGAHDRGHDQGEVVLAQAGLARGAVPTGRVVQAGCLD